MKNIMLSNAQFIVMKEHPWRFRELDKFEVQDSQMQMEALMYGAWPPNRQSRNEWDCIILRSKTKKKKPLLFLYITPTSWLAFLLGGFYGWCPEAPPPERTNRYLSVVCFIEVFAVPRRFQLEILNHSIGQTVGNFSNFSNWILSPINSDQYQVELIRTGWKESDQCIYNWRSPDNILSRGK